MRTFFVMLFCSICVMEHLSAQERIAPYPNIAIDMGKKYDGVKRTFVHLGVLGHSERVDGFAFDLLGHFAKQRVNGVQASGLWNITRGPVDGVQASSLFNFGSHIHGFQLTGLLNITTSSAHGIQIAGVTNLSIDGKGLTQIALNNIVLKDLEGVQVGINNYAGSLKGVQVGLLNISDGERMHGVQVGLINISRDTSAVKVGLVNINPTTRIQMMVFAGNNTKLNGAIRFRNEHFYSILGAGLYNKGLDDKFSGTLYYRAGLHYAIASRWRVCGDVGFAHLENSEKDTNYEAQRMFALQTRLGIEYKCSSKLAVFGTGGHSMQRRYGRHHSFAHKPIVELGILLF